MKSARGVRMVEVGIEAADFSLPDSNGNTVSLFEFRGNIVVLYFYPKDDTPGCTIEAVDFTKLRPEFEKIGAIILGVSSDSCESHIRFTKKRKLGIILLSDEDAEVQKKYGVWRKKNYMGKEFDGTARVTFLIGKDGKVTKIWDPVVPLGHAKAVLEEAKK